jgi:hypothetical protein
LRFASSAPSRLRRLEAFIEKLGTADIPVVRYDPQELDSELAALG